MKELYHREVPFLLRAIGCWAIQESDKRPLLRFSWGELSFNWGLALGYSVYHEDAHINIHLGPFNLFLKMPMLIKQRPGTEDWNAHYGLSVFERDMHLNWRTRCKVIHFPWDWTQVRHTFLNPDGSVHHHEVRTRGYEEPPAETKERHDYTYIRRSGEIQKRIATINGEEREWRWLWFTWLPFPRRISRSIWVDFDGEVGEGTGGWKGGTLGCGYDWRHGESMVQSLRRMERERKF